MLKLTKSVAATLRNVFAQVPPTIFSYKHIPVQSQLWKN